MKKIALAALAAFAAIATSLAQTKTWIDVTDTYITNPRYDGNNLSGWSGTALGAVNPKENAEHYHKNYDTYQKLTGLKPGTYRLSLDAFYRMGSASNDYNLFSSGNYASSQHAKLYATSSTGEVTAAIAPSSSGKTTTSLGGGTSRVGSRYFIPNNMEAAYYWFNAGYYDNSLQCTVGSDGKLTIGIRKTETLIGDWTCIDNWKLEYYGELVNVTSITLNHYALTLVPQEESLLTAKVMPEDATYTTVDWASGNTAVATVSSDGKVTAVATGTAVITATAKDGSGVQASCRVTVEKGATPSAENIVINEIMAANVDVYRDPSTNFGSWVELYNPTDKSVTLGGLYISNDALNLKQHRLVDYYGALGAHGYAILNFDHREVYTKAAWRQIDDKLDADGGTIIISDGTTILAQQDYPAAVSRASYARTIDGGEEWGTTALPSPGYSNSTNGGFCSQQLDAPVVTPDGQLFTGTLNVKVDIPAGATLRYTTDGSTPTMENGETSATGEFQVTSSTCFRFRLFQDGYLPRKVLARTFIYNNGKEPFPIISVITDESSLFKSEYGIFCYTENGRTGNGQSRKYNANMDWDRPVNFEYITADNRCVINQECNFSACGGWSRAFSPHSFKLKANKIYYGKNSFDYQFFAEKPFLKHKTLQIRNGGNDTGARVKDAALQQIVARSGLYVEYQSWQPVHVYINAEPYAVLNMREPNNKHYGYANYGIDTDLMDQFEICPDSGYVQKEGTIDAFNRWYDLSANAASAEAYDEICGLVDIDEFVNYMAVEMYAGGTDWPQNNVKAFRGTEDGRFRFVLFDLDHALGTSTPLTQFFGKQNYTFDSLYGYDYSTNESLDGKRRTMENKFVTIFKNMLANDTFRKKFTDAFCLVAGSVFAPERVEKVVTDVANYLSQGGYVSPWGTAQSLISGLSASRQTKLIDHLKSVSQMQLSAVTPQSVTLASSIDGAAILVNGMEVPTGRFAGQLFAPVTLEAKAPIGYTFKGWQAEDENGNTAFVSEDKTYEMPASGAQKLTAVWEKAAGSEAGSGIVPVKINELSPGNDMYVNEYIKKDDWVELYNTTDVDINASGLYLSDNAEKPLKYQIKGAEGINTIIPAHGHLVVWCSKRTQVSQLHASFKLANDEGSQLILTAGADFVAANSALYEAYPKCPKEFTDTLAYGVTAADNTVGRYPDGAATYYVMHHPTICKANSKQGADSVAGVDYADEVTYITGDVNGDGEVTVADANMIVNHYTGNLDGTEKFSEKAADMNGDGEITIADANEIVNMYVGQE